MTYSTTDVFIQAWSNYFNEGRPGILNINGKTFAGKVLTIAPQIRVTIDGKPGAIILTLQQFRAFWEDAKE